MNSIEGQSNTEISLNECCDYLEQSTVLQSVDLGSALVHLVSHPTLGTVTLVNTTCGRSALVKLN